MNRFVLNTASRVRSSILAVAGGNSARFDGGTDTGTGISGSVRGDGTGAGDSGSGLTVASDATAGGRRMGGHSDSLLIGDKRRGGIMGMTPLSGRIRTNTEDSYDEETGYAMGAGTRTAPTSATSSPTDTPMTSPRSSWTSSFNKSFISALRFNTDLGSDNAFHKTMFLDRTIRVPREYKVSLRVAAAAAVEKVGHGGAILTSDIRKAERLIDDRRVMHLAAVHAAKADEDGAGAGAGAGAANRGSATTRVMDAVRRTSRGMSAVLARGSSLANLTVNLSKIYVHPENRHEFESLVHQLETEIVIYRSTLSTDEVVTFDRQWGLTRHKKGRNVDGSGGGHGARVSHMLEGETAESSALWKVLPTVPLYLISTICDTNHTYPIGNSPNPTTTTHTNIHDTRTGARYQVHLAQSGRGGDRGEHCHGANRVHGGPLRWRGDHPSVHGGLPGHPLEPRHDLP